MKKFFYRVQKQDSIMSLSVKFNECAFKMIEDNSLKKEIESGDILFIESQDEPLYLVKPQDTLLSLSKKFNKDQDLILKENNLPYLFCGLKIKV